MATENSAIKGSDAKFVSKTLQTVFIALLIDILAFTIILPLFPRLLLFYNEKDGNNPESFYFTVLQSVRTFKTFIGASGSRLDFVLLGGAVGSLFSFLQFISSPYIGSLSDTYGRRTILLWSMVGNGLSMFLWLFGDTFEIFLFSRIIGGLTEGNVQMSIALISDITTPETRSRGLALVGIAFSLGFTMGPPLGAYFTKFNLKQIFPSLKSLPINDYSSPALFALVLIVIETVYLYFALPETKDFKSKGANKSARLSAKSTIAEKPNAPKQPPTINLQSKKLVWSLSVIHFLYLLFFSGMEFTLTFLTYDRFDFSHGKQGMLLGYMGFLSAMVQGGYVRRLAGKKIPEKHMAMQGILSCSIGLIICAFSTTVPILFLGATFLAFTSGTVVSSLTALTSLAGEANSKQSSITDSTSEFETLQKDQRGLALGRFRSLGQLGRSIGPILACSVYWILGPKIAYIVSAVLLLFVLVLFSTWTVKLIGKEQHKHKE
ncbi:hypothetical protein HK096_007840 [Nowakowskiella sp. JEL0078]|nr:hypothetical protein HK096_007840 [Nowakowskiella sp. JEL0078]